MLLLISVSSLSLFPFLALAGPQGLSEETLREAILTLETKVHSQGETLSSTAQHPVDIVILLWVIHSRKCFYVGNHHVHVFVAVVHS